ncbi:hypothetical protein CVE26_25260, partial [Pseudomonas syringae pv. actinidiae]|nr:hypothetical protein [Pseudomonas syringae pv. actinidiae]
MHFVTLRVTAICDGRDACSRLESPFRPSATDFEDQSRQSPSSVSGPTSSGSFALSLIRGSLQRAILGPECVKTRQNVVGA